MMRDTQAPLFGAEEKNYLMEVLLQNDGQHICLQGEFELLGTCDKIYRVYSLS